MPRVIIVLLMAFWPAIAVGQPEETTTPPGLIAAGIDVIEKHVLSWYDDGTLRIGTPDDLDAWTGGTEYTIPDGRTPADIVAIAVAAEAHVFAWYRDGTWSRGSADDLGRFRPPRPFRLPDHRDPTQIVGATCTVHELRRVFHVWYDDGMFSAGNDRALWLHEIGRPYRVATGQSPADVVAIGAGADSGVVAWYRDGTFSVGTPEDLAATQRVAAFTVDGRDHREGPVTILGRPVQMGYEVHGGIAYAQGDIELGPVGTLDGSGPPSHERRAVEVKCAEAPKPNTRELYEVAPGRWWGGIMPYTIVERHFTPPEIKMIHEAARVLTGRTHLTVRPRRDEADHIEIVRPARAGMGGTSPVGRRGEAQKLRLNTVERPLVMHELLHASGMGHEHCRHDRDRYVTVIEENIEPEFAMWFNVVPEIAPAELPYDLRSIMHYSSRAFGRKDPMGGRLQTIVPRRRKRLVRNRALSDLDVQRVNAMYPMTLAGKANIFIARDTGCVEAWGWTKSHKSFLRSAWPFPTGYGVGDVFLAGRFMGEVVESIVVVDGDTKDAELFTYDGDSAPQRARTLRIEEGACLAAGDVIGDRRTELVTGDDKTLRVYGVRRGRLAAVAEPLEIAGAGPISAAVGKVGHATKSKIVCHRAGGPFSTIRFSAVDGPHQRAAPSLDAFVSYDPVAIGNLAGDERGELLLVDRFRGAAAMLERTGVDFTVIGEVQLDMNGRDHIAVGDVAGDERDEIVIAPAAGGEAIVIAWTGRRFELVAKFTVPASGALAIGLPGYRP